MAAKHVYRQGFLLLLFNFMSAAALERRFSDIKRCADKECSMLLCRGKAVNDFSGPDCRFLSFKKSETIYVYYKLSGRRPDIWAGSVGSHFGYFPKDLLAVNHIYTDNEYEVPAEETDFVCFDTGFDKFDNYDVDLLLGLSAGENDSENNKTSYQVQAAEAIETREEVAQSEKQTEHHDNLEELHKAPDDQSASSAVLDQSAETPLQNTMESNAEVARDATEAEEVKEKHVPESVPENLSEKSETKDTPAKSEVESVPKDDFVSESEPVSSSEGVQIPELKTTIGSTFDAIVTDEEITEKITPYEEEEESVDVENHPESGTNVKEETPLFSFSEDSINTQPSVEIPKLKTTLGTTFDAVITDEDTTKKVTPYTEEDSEDVEDHPENNSDTKEETPLLCFSEESVNTPASDSIKKPETPLATPEDKPKTAEEKNVWTSLGDAVFSAVTGVDITTQEVNSEQEEDDDERVPIPKLKTTLGTTFDAVVTDEESTKKVTPNPEDDSEDVKDQPKNDSDTKEETPLLSFSRESSNTPTPESPRNPESLPLTPEDRPKTAEEKNMWTSLGDAVFSAVTGVDMSAKKVNEEEDEDEEDEEEEDVKTHDESLLVKSPEDPENMEPVLQDSLNSTSDNSNVNEGTSDSEKVLSDKNENDVEVTGHKEAQDETKKSAEDQIEHLTEGMRISTEPLPQDNNLDNHEAEVTHIKTTHEATKDKDEQEVPKDSEITEDKDEQEVPKDSEITEDKDEQEVPNDSEITEDKDEQEEPKDSEITEDKDEQEEPKDSEATEDKDEQEVPKDSEATEDKDEQEVPKDSEATKDKDEQEVHKDPDVTEDKAAIPDSITAAEQELDSAVDEKENMTESEKHLDLSANERSSDSDLRDDDNVVNDSLPNQIPDDSMTDLGSNNSRAESPVDEPEIQDALHTREMMEEDETPDAEEGNDEEREELLEDENALLFSQSDKTLPETSPPTVSPPEPEYSESVMRLTLLWDHFTEEKMEQVQKLLGLKNLFKLEAMFMDLDIEFQATRQSQTGTTEDIENALEGILEASENTILDEIEKMLDSRDTKHDYDHHMDPSNLDEETEILDDFQELAFSLRQKYSTASDSTPLALELSSDTEKDEQELNVKEDVLHIAEEELDKIPKAESDDNLTITDPEEKPAEVEEEQLVRPDVSVEEDGGHFNKNKDNPLSFSTSDEMQKVPQATLENAFDMGLGVEVEHSPSGSMDSMEPVSEVHEEEVGLFSTGLVYTGCILAMITNKTAEWSTVMISLLPEEWKPGETLFGCPWQAVVITALVGVLTFTLFFWRTVLAIKKKEYLVDEKRLREQIQVHKKEKDEALAKMAELQKQTEQLKENQKQSKETVSCTVKKMQELESKVLQAETLNKQMAEEKDKYAQLLEEERANTLQNETRIEKLEKLNEKLQANRKKIQEALSKTTVLLDEAKIREDARNVQQKCLEKEFAALKDENKTLKVTIKSWEEKHTELNEKIKVYQKSQKELEDSVVLKDHNVEVLSELLSDLEACDLQKGDTKVLANGEVAPVSLTDKKTAVKNRIKQMMDVSRVQTTLAVVEEERDRFMTKLLNEEKSRKAMEEQHQELEHAISTLKSEKSHIENQFKILQQKNEIMVEMYQQKENALQQKLTKEELERRSKENLLSEVGGKAVEAEEQVKILRQRINEMEDQMKKTEEVYKEQIKEQENKTHSNWVNARNAERALNQEKLESSKLREKLAVLTSQLNERRAPLFRPNSGQPAGPRQGDSYGPSPVSGGAPSPPIMIEGPRRPPSAPVARRIDPFGPRPPSDPHGRYPEKHISGMDMMGPRSSSPANLDASTQAVDPQIKTETKAEVTTENPEAGPGSFIASPIRDSPGPMVHGPPPGPAPYDPMLPPGRLPPPIAYRPPRPGPYHLPPGPPLLQGPPLPANGHPGMPLPGPMGGEFGPPNGLAIPPRQGPGPGIDPRGPLPPQFRPPPPHHFGPMPPPQGVRGPMGPRPPFPPDMRFPLPRDHPGQPVDLPLGAPPHPAHPGDAYGPPAPDALQNSVAAHSVPRQDLHVKQEAPQDSARPEMVKP
ncbi:transport and Golgi organization protein 1 homolog isoform X1 [Astatotilapia calliptera]|uniref:transport and Golgi organization protein 1 homolog isoform X1 n=1 Tax=Astatotilapia calliptera TaxID=8154 RepID=UPI000E40A1B0|nr:transport and Golgi organization protein 1 homolog isoform X1 [Astatotilapia calliptera]